MQVNSCVVLNGNRSRYVLIRSTFKHRNNESSEISLAIFVICQYNYAVIIVSCTLNINGFVEQRARSKTVYGLRRNNTTFAFKRLVKGGSSLCVNNFMHVIDIGLIIIISHFLRLTS